MALAIGEIVTRIGRSAANHGRGDRKRGDNEGEFDHGSISCEAVVAKLQPLLHILFPHFPDKGVVVVMDQGKGTEQRIAEEVEIGVEAD